MKLRFQRPIILTMILSASLNALASDLDCSQLMNPEPSATALVASPAMRAANQVQNGRQLLEQGRRGADAFLQVAFVQTNRTLNEIGRVMTVENLTPLKTGSEIEAEKRAFEISARLDRIIALAAQAKAPQGFFAKNVFRKEAPATMLEMEINIFFEQDVANVMEFETRRKTVLGQLEEEELRISELLSKLQHEQDYVTSLVTRIHANPDGSSLAGKIDVEIDFQLSEKLRHISEYEATLSQALLKVQMRIQQLSLIAQNMSAVRARVPIAAAHIPSFLALLEKYEAQQAIVEKERQRVAALPGNQARMREKNSERHGRVDEIRSQRRAHQTKIDEFWSASRSQTGVIMTNTGVVSGIVEAIEPAFDRVVFRARTDTRSVNIDHLFLTRVPKEFFGLEAGNYIKDSRNSKSGRIVGLSRKGDLLVEGAFETFIILKRDAATPSSLELQILEKYDVARFAIKSQWSDPNLRGQGVFVRLDDGTFVDGEVLSIDEGRLLIARSGESRFFDADRVALQKVRSTSQWKPRFPVGSTVSDGQRLGTVIGFFMNGDVLFEAVASKDNKAIDRQVKAEEYLMPARFPKPIYEIGSVVIAVDTVSTAMIQTTYTVLKFDPATKSYLVRPANDYLRGKFRDLQFYSIRSGWALEESAFSETWLSAEQLKQIYFRNIYERDEKNHVNQGY